MVHLCECGCGKLTLLARSSRPERGYVKGQPLRFCHGHAGGIPRKTHGMRRTPEFRAYSDAKRRCSNPRSKRWNSYGGRGIQFRFDSFEQFFAELGFRPSSQHSLDRKNNDGNYEPGNVRWATTEEQMATRRLSGAALISHERKALILAFGGDCVSSGERRDASC